MVTHLAARLSPADRSRARARLLSDGLLGLVPRLGRGAIVRHFAADASAAAVLADDADVVLAGGSAAAAHGHRQPRRLLLPWPHGGSGGTGGGGVRWRIACRYAPALDWAARELRVTARDLRWMGHVGTGQPAAPAEVVTGPWTFGVPLPAVGRATDDRTPRP